MFKTIVAGTDGSADAEAALQAVVELAKVNPDAEIHVVTAYRPLSMAEIDSLASELPREYRPLLSTRFHADSHVASARSLFRNEDIDAEFHEVDDDPTEALLDTAKECGADLIVVGSRGEGGVKRALHGSVSTKVLHHAPCSVLVVRHDA